MWEHEKGVLGDCVIDSLKDGEVDKTEQNTDIWEKILQQREQDALAEAAQSQQLLGRGGRRRQAVTYTNVVDKKHKSIANSDVDEDYHQSNEEDEDEAGDNQGTSSLNAFALMGTSMAKLLLVALQRPLPLSVASMNNALINKHSRSGHWWISVQFASTHLCRLFFSPNRAIRA